MHQHIRRQAVSFRQALHGISWAFYTQPHLQFHVIVGLLVMILGTVLGVSFIEMAVLTLTIFFVLVVELLNTGVEAVVNLVTDEWQGYAKVAKDVCAGAVFVASLGAMFVGCFIFVPKLLLLLSTI